MPAQSPRSSAGNRADTDRNNQAGTADQGNMLDTRTAKSRELVNWREGPTAEDFTRSGLAGQGKL